MEKSTMVGAGVSSISISVVISSMAAPPSASGARVLPAPDGRGPGGVNASIAASIP